LKFNIFSENIYPDWELDERKFIGIAKKLLKYYLQNDTNICHPELVPSFAEICDFVQNGVTQSNLIVTSGSSNDTNRVEPNGGRCLNKFGMTEKVDISTISVISFDILYCGSEKTHQINKEYRGKDYPADIITFAIFADTPPEERFVFDGEINLGEIIIALDKVIEEAQKKEIAAEDELIWLISHGILHLLGFDHSDEAGYNRVVGLQKEAIRSLKLK